MRGIRFGGASSTSTASHASAGAAAADPVQLGSMGTCTHACSTAFCGRWCAHPGTVQALSAPHAKCR